MSEGEMKIPNSFKLMGKTINVSYRDDLHHDDSVEGWAKYRTNEIVLQAQTTSVPIPADNLEQTFFHELTHHVLYAAGEEQFDPPLHKREYLVDRIAGLLHQAITTFEYKEPEK